MYRESEINPGVSASPPEFRNYPRAALARAHHDICAQYSAVQPAGRSRRGLGYFADEKAFPRNIQRFSCDFRLDITDFGKKNVRSRETRKNQGNLEAAVKGNSHGGVAGMLKLTAKALKRVWTKSDSDLPSVD